jgi:hypothetical protein
MPSLTDYGLTLGLVTRPLPVLSFDPRTFSGPVGLAELLRYNSLEPTLKNYLPERNALSEAPPDIAAPIEVDSLRGLAPAPVRQPHRYLAVELADVEDDKRDRDGAIAMEHPPPYTLERLPALEVDGKAFAVADAPD